MPYLKDDSNISFNESLGVFIPKRAMGPVIKLRVELQKIFAGFLPDEATIQALMLSLMLTG